MNEAEPRPATETQHGPSQRRRHHEVRGGL